MPLRFSILVLTLVSLVLCETAADAAERPNILWISCEDISPDLRCYGDDYAISPNIDRLASQGVRYTRAFSHSGVCAPTRSGIITGMYPISIGTHNMRCKGVPPAEVRCFSEYLRAAGYYCTNNVKTDYQFNSPITAWDASSNKAHWRDRPKDRPFFAVINITTSHESQIRDPRKLTQQLVAKLKPEQRHDPAQATLPKYYPDTPIVRRDWANYHDNITAMDGQVGEILQQLEEDGLGDDTIVWFWGDHGRGLPRGKRWIYDSGLQIPLIIRVPEKWRDQVLPGGADQLAPGTVNDDLVAFVDFAPTMLSLAGVPIPKHIQGQAFLGAQKAKPRQYIYAARDRMDERYDLIRAVRDKRFKYIRNQMQHIPYSQNIWYMNLMPTMQEMRRLNAEGQLVGPQKLYFRQIKPAEELYDTAADPEELNNLAGDPKYAAKLAELREALRKWRDDVGDVGLIPEPEFDEMKRPGGNYQTAAAPQFVVENINDSARTYEVSIHTATPGGSIAYRLGSSSQDTKNWHLYTQPVTVPPGARLFATASRIGFQNSKTVEFDPQSAAKQSPKQEGGGHPHWRDVLNQSGLLTQLSELKSLDETDPATIAKYREALESEHGSVRYWAVVGLHRQSDGGDEIQQAIRGLLQDPAPVVRVAAAQAIADWGDPETGVPLLVKLLQHPQDSVRLYAAIALGELGEQARPALPAIKLALDDKFKYVMRVCEYTIADLENPKP